MVKNSPLCLGTVMHLTFPSGLAVKKIHLPRQETLVQSLGWKDPQEKEMAPDSNILA